MQKKGKEKRKDVCEGLHGYKKYEGCYDTVV